MPFFEAAEDWPAFEANISCGGSCKRVIVQKHSIFVCGFCNKAYHPQCKGIIGAAKVKKAAESSWFCSTDCTNSATHAPEKISTPTKTNMSASGQQWEPTVFNLMKRMNEEFAIVKTMITTLKDSQEFICKEVDEIKSSINSIAAENIILTNNHETLQKICKIQEDRINELEYRMDGFQQRELNSNLIVDGLPDNTTDPNALAERILNHLQCPELLVDVCNCEYMSSRSSTRANASPSQYGAVKLIIKFKNQLAKRKAMQQKKRIKPMLFSNDIDLQQKKQLFFRDHLTTFRHSLYRDALKFKKNYNYKYLWIQEGNILLRKSEGSIISRIQSKADITRMAAKLQISGQAQDHES